MDEKKLEHVAIIMDGNRHYAKKHAMPIAWGHKKGYDALKHFLEYFPKYNIPEVSFFGFSTENFHREKNEVNNLFKLMTRGLRELIHEKTQYRITFPGNRTQFPSELQQLMQTIERDTAMNTTYRVNICLGYGGRDELTRATKQIVEKIQHGSLVLNDITENLIQKHLDVQHDVDLLIRTSQNRISNFLIWQTSYAEVIFQRDLYWPEFSEDLFKACIEKYYSSERTKGK